MTTNLSAIAGPSRQEVNTAVQAKVEPASPINPVGPNEQADVGVSKPGLTVGENGEVVKVPAFLNKLYRWVSSQFGHPLTPAAWFPTPRRTT